MGCFGLALGYLCGLVWLAGKRRNLRLLEGLELILGDRVDGGGIGRLDIWLFLVGGRREEWII